MGMKARQMKLRFEMDAENQCYKVRACSKMGQWQQIGTCHLQAKDEIKGGKVELIQFNMGKES